MKKLLLFCFILSFLQLPVFSQHCLPEGITFSTQAQIDSFQVNYPGCTIIEGDVFIYGDEISDFSGISVLDSIFGDLNIEDTHMLQDMIGLDNLQFIGGDLYIYNNDWLLNLTGLENLTYVGGSVIIDSNFELTSLSGLGSLTSIGGSLTIGFTWGGNDALTTLSGLDNLVSMGGGLTISSNDNLISLTGLENVTSIGGDLVIFYNTSLTSLSALENINASSIGRIWIVENHVLSMCNIQGICEYLADLHEMIEIYNNGPGCDNPNEIAHICGITLSCLPFGNYYFTSQANVDSFPSYYPDCHKLEGYTRITGDNITNLDSLTGIDTINGSLCICGNNNLVSLNGLNNLRAVQGELCLGYYECGSNPKLTDLAGLNKLTTVSDGMLLLGNGGLLSLSGLDSLTSVGGQFGIFESPLLKNLNGLIRLDSVHSIRIAGNDSLISLDGLQSLTYAGIIDVIYNPMLITLDGIENVDAENLSYLNIHDNDSLTECNVRSVCDFLINYSGHVDIYNNSTGCDSAQEVKAACEVGIEDVVSRQSSVVSYPNPVADLVTFDIKLPESARVKLTIFNSLGSVITTILDEQLEKGEHQITWNSEGLAPGIYFYRISMYDQHSAGKLIITR